MFVNEVKGRLYPGLRRGSRWCCVRFSLRAASVMEDSSAVAELRMMDTRRLLPARALMYSDCVIKDNWFDCCCITSGRAVRVRPFFFCSRWSIGSFLPTDGWRHDLLDHLCGFLQWRGRAPRLHRLPRKILVSALPRPWHCPVRPIKTWATS